MSAKVVIALIRSIPTFQIVGRHLVSQTSLSKPSFFIISSHLPCVTLQPSLIGLLGKFCNEVQNIQLLHTNEHNEGKIFKTNNRCHLVPVPPVLVFVAGPLNLFCDNIYVLFFEYLLLMSTTLLSCPHYSLELGSLFQTWNVRICSC